MTATIALPRPQQHSDWLARLRTIQVGLAARGAVGLGLARGGARAAKSVSVVPVKDTFLNDYSEVTKTRNYGAAQQFEWGTANSIYLYTFDLSAIPVGAICKNATFDLVTAQVRSTERTAFIYQLSAANVDYGEGNKNNTAAENGEASWNFKDHGLGVAWAGSAGTQTAGIDYIDTILGVIVYPASTPAGTKLATTLNASGISAIQTAFGGYITLRVQVNNLTIGPYTREAGTPGNRPALTIVY